MNQSSVIIESNVFSIMLIYEYMVVFIFVNCDYRLEPHIGYYLFLKNFFFLNFTFLFCRISSPDTSHTDGKRLKVSIFRFFLLFIIIFLFFIVIILLTFVSLGTVSVVREW